MRRPLSYHAIVSVCCAVLCCQSQRNSRHETGCTRTRATRIPDTTIHTSGKDLYLCPKQKKTERRGRGGRKFGRQGESENYIFEVVHAIPKRRRDVGPTRKRHLLRRMLPEKLQLLGQFVHVDPTCSASAAWFYSSNLTRGKGTQRTCVQLPSCYRAAPLLSLVVRCHHLVAFRVVLRRNSRNVRSRRVAGAWTPDPTTDGIVLP